MTDKRDDILGLCEGYFHGLLSEQEKAHVEQQVERSRVWQAAFEEAEQRYQALSEVTPTEPSEELLQRTLQRVDRDAMRIGRRRKWATTIVTGAIAATIVFLASFHAYHVMLEPSPYDLRLLGQDELFAGADASLRLRLIDHNTRAPVSNADVSIALHNPQTDETVELTRLVTNVDGTGQPRFTLPDWQPGEYELRLKARPGGDSETLTRTITLTRQWQIMLSTDKPVYQPGQTILVRSLSLRRPDLQPVAGAEVVYSIVDPKGNVIYKQRDVTSKFGIAATECAMADEIIEGPYTIRCQVGETETERTVEVKKYVLPKFKIGVDLDQPYYQPGQTVKGTVNAKYFFGKVVIGGTVDVELTLQGIAGKTIQVPQLKTDAEGNAKFEFRLPDRLRGREQDGGDARFIIDATVTDTAGQQQVRSTSRVVTDKPLRLEVIAESGTLVKDVANTVYVFASYADGRPAKARLSVSGIERELTTSKLGVAVFELTAAEGKASLVVKATDMDGLTGRKTVDLEAGAYPADFLIRPDKAVYTGGETMELLALGGGVEPVFIDIIKDGQTVLTDTVTMKDGRGELGFDLPAELFGTLQLVAYRYENASGLPVRKSRVIFVRQAREVNITATLDRSEYRPGRQAKLQLALTDADGKPVPGAISLAAVDEAVFAVLSQRPGMEQTFFTLEQELLEPVYAIYHWYPGMAPQPFEPGFVPIDEPPMEVRFEAALFAATADVQFAEYDWAGAGEGIAEHTLTATSYPQKISEVTMRKERALGAMPATWTLTIALSFIAVTALMYYLRRFIIGGVMTAMVVVTMCAGLLLPALASSRRFHMVNEAMPQMLMEFADDMGMEMDPDEVMKGGMAFPPEKTEEEGGSATAPPRVREWFPETLLWRPEIVTDDDGKASLDINLADSITTWRLSASAVSGRGDLGAMQGSIRVFQPFFVDLNLPVALTRGDEVAVPAVVYNYLDKAQQVTLSLEDGEWFELLDDAQKVIELQPGEVKAVAYRLRVKTVGRHSLQVTARGDGAADIADAIKREITVEPDGLRVEQLASGTLADPAHFTLEVPDNAIPGSVRTIVKLYPSAFSQVVEGLDNIFQQPYGCFEQTSSTTYPNVLALDYLRRTKQNVPEAEAKAKQYIHLGYQRLVSFEVDGGGFDWFGNPPANRTLTAYGLMEFQDMAKVHDVDPKLIERTRQWLLKQRKADGSWAGEPGMLNDGLAGSVQRGGDVNLVTTAYIGWAVFADQNAANQADATRQYLMQTSPDKIQSPYVLALVTNALLAMDTGDGRIKPYLERLDELKQTTDDGKQTWWAQPEGERCMFYGGGRSGDIEITALAALAYIESGFNSPATRGALTWLIGQKDAKGTWHSTQATVLAFKALLEGTGESLGGDKQRDFDITVNGEVVQQVTLDVDQSDVMKQIDLTDLVSKGGREVSITETSATGAGYQIAHRFHVPEVAVDPSAVEPLDIDITYDRAELAVNDTLKAVVSVNNQSGRPAPMVILDLPVPAGFAVDRDAFATMVDDGVIAKYQVTARKVIVYLRDLPLGDPMELRYSLRATMPVKIQVPGAAAYEYYNPDQRGRSETVLLTVTDA